MVISDPTPTEESKASKSYSEVAETQAVPKPSQAEGERQPSDSAGMDTPPIPKPSQAEGDRETVEEDIREKEQKGELF